MSNEKLNTIKFPQTLDDALKVAEKAVADHNELRLKTAMKNTRLVNDAYDQLEQDYNDLRKKHSRKIQALLDEHAEELKMATQGALFVGGVVGSALTIMVGVGFKALSR